MGVWSTTKQLTETHRQRFKRIPKHRLQPKLKARVAGCAPSLTICVLSPEKPRWCKAGPSIVGLSQSRREASRHPPGCAASRASRAKHKHVPAKVPGDSPFFPTIVLFENRPFPRVSGGFLERRIPGKNGESSTRMMIILAVRQHASESPGCMAQPDWKNMSLAATAGRRGFGFVMPSTSCVPKPPAMPKRRHPPR